MWAEVIFGSLGDLQEEKKEASPLLNRRKPCFHFFASKAFLRKLAYLLLSYF